MAVDSVWAVKAKRLCAESILTCAVSTLTWTVLVSDIGGCGVLTCIVSSSAVAASEGANSSHRLTKVDINSDCSINFLIPYPPADKMSNRVIISFFCKEKGLALFALALNL